MDPENFNGTDQKPDLIYNCRSLKLKYYVFSLVRDPTLFRVDERYHIAEMSFLKFVLTSTFSAKFETKNGKRANCIMQKF